MTSLPLPYCTYLAVKIWYKCRPPFFPPGNATVPDLIRAVWITSCLCCYSLDACRQHLPSTCSPVYKRKPSLDTCCPPNAPRGIISNPPRPTGRVTMMLKRFLRMLKSTTTLRCIASMACCVQCISRQEPICTQNPVFMRLPLTLTGVSCIVHDILQRYATKDIQGSPNFKRNRYKRAS